MIGTPYLAGGVAIALLATGWVSYNKGYANGENHVKAEIARQMEENVRKLREAEERIGHVVFQQQQREVERQTTVREIYRDVPTIITRPVYNATCIDADGVRLLDRAANAANGTAHPLSVNGRSAAPPFSP